MKRVFEICIKALVVIVFITGVTVVMNKRHRKAETASAKLFENVFFEGEVVSVYEKRGNCIMCVRLDSASTDHFFHFDHYGALKIENGIATLPLGQLDKYNSEDMFLWNASYVIVNKDTSRQILFISGGDTLRRPLTFWPGKLNQYSMLWCDDAAEEQLPHEHSDD